MKALNLGQPSKTVSETEKIQIEDSDVSIALQKGVRSCTVHPLSNFVKYNHLSNSVQSLVKNLEVVEIPKTVQEALESLQWKQAILDKMRALEKNQTWKVVPRPHNKVHVGCRWVFTVKKTRLMGQLNVTRQGWLLRDTHRHMELTTRKHLPR